MIKLRIALIIFLLPIIHLKSQTRITTDYKDYRFEIFDISKIKKLDIRGQHANINLLNWEKDSISVETTIEILSDKPNLSKEMLDEVKIKIVTYSNTLQVKTTLSKDFNRTIPYKINYNIFFPKHLALNLSNAHGTINISEISGGVIANISYCDVNIKNISSEDSLKNKIDLSFCNGNINHLGSANLNIKNTNINIFEATSVDCKSEYSTYSFKHINSFKGYCNIDNIEIGSLQNISLQGNSSLVTLESFNDSAFFKLDQGRLQILNSATNFKELLVDNNQTNTQIKLNNSSSYSINGEISNGEFIHPKSKQLVVIKEQNKISVSGEVGTNPNSSSKVIFFNQNQSIEFK